MLFGETDWDITTLEQDFINLLSQGYSQGTFERFAKVILGEEDWKKLGREITKEFAPELLERFDEYASK